MMTADTPEDYVIGTGRMHSVRELVETAFSSVGLDWERYVVHDPSLHRPAAVDLLCADPKKAKTQLGWEPTVAFEELVAMMVESDLRLLAGGGDPDQDSSWP